VVAANCLKLTMNQDLAYIRDAVSAIGLSFPFPLNLSTIFEFGRERLLFLRRMFFVISEEICDIAQIDDQDSNEELMKKLQDIVEATSCHCGSSDLRAHVQSGATLPLFITELALESAGVKCVHSLEQDALLLHNMCCLSSTSLSSTSASFYFHEEISSAEACAGSIDLLVKHHGMLQHAETGILTRISKLQDNKNLTSYDLSDSVVASEEICDAAQQFSEAAAELSRIVDVDLRPWLHSDSNHAVSNPIGNIAADMVSSVEQSSRVLKNLHAVRMSLEARQHQRDEQFGPISHRIRELRQFLDTVDAR
jgi:hypothetical protein